MWRSPANLLRCVPIACAGHMTVALRLRWLSCEQDDVIGVCRRKEDVSSTWCRYTNIVELLVRGHCMKYGLQLCGVHVFAVCVMHPCHRVHTRLRT